MGFALYGTDLYGTGIYGPLLQKYVLSNLSLDSASGVYGGSNLVIQNGVIRLVPNIPAIDATHDRLFARLAAGSGSSILDESANANNGSFTASNDDPKWDSSFSGNGAARFNATGYYTSNDYIDCGAILQYEYTQSFSVQCAIQIGNGQTPPTNGAGIIYTNCHTSPNFRGHEWWVDHSGKLHARLINSITGGYVGVYGSTNVCDGNWHVVGLRYTGTGTYSGFQFYVDGKAETMTMESNNLSGATIVSSDHFWIGNQSTQSYGFGGLIDGFRFWSSDKGDAFFTTIYPKSIAPATGTEIAYDFEETSGTTAFDLSGNGRNGTATNNRVLNAFKVGAAGIIFNQSSADFISFPHVSDYNLGSTFTVFSWLNVVSVSNGAALYQHYPGSGGWGLMLSWSNGNIQFWDGAAFRDTGYALSAGLHAVAIRATSSTSLDLWVDGTKQATITISALSGGSTPLAMGYWTAEMTATLGFTKLVNTNLSDPTIQQFSKARPASGIASLSSPSTAIASGGGDYGQTVNFSSFTLTGTTPTTTTLKVRAGAASSAAAATTAKLAASWVTVSSGAGTLTGVTGRYLDFDVQFLPSTDTLARDTPSLTDITFVYSPPVNYTDASGSTIALVSHAARVAGLIRGPQSSITPIDQAARIASYLKTLSAGHAPATTQTAIRTSPKAVSVTQSSANTMNRTYSGLRAVVSTDSLANTITRAENEPRSLVTTVPPSSTITHLDGLLRSILSTVAPSTTNTHVRSVPLAVHSTIALSSTVSRLAGYVRTIASTIALATTASKGGSSVKSVASTVAPATTITKLDGVLRSLVSTLTSLASITRVQNDPRSGASALSPSETTSRSFSLVRADVSTVALATLASHNSNSTKSATNTTPPVSHVSEAYALVRTDGSTVTPATTGIRGGSTAKSALSTVAPSSLQSHQEAQARSLHSTLTATTGAADSRGQARTGGSGQSPLNSLSARFSGIRGIASSVPGAVIAVKQGAQQRGVGSAVTLHTLGSAFSAKVQNTLSTLAPATLASRLAHISTAVHMGATLQTLAGTGSFQRRTSLATQFPVTLPSPTQSLGRSVVALDTPLAHGSRVQTDPRGGSSSVPPATLQGFSRGYPRTPNSTIFQQALSSRLAAYGKALASTLSSSVLVATNRQYARLGLLSAISPTHTPTRRENEPRSAGATGISSLSVTRLESQARTVSSMLSSSATDDHNHGSTRVGSTVIALANFASRLTPARHITVQSIVQALTPTVAFKNGHRLYPAGILFGRVPATRTIVATIPAQGRPMPLPQLKLVAGDDLPVPFQLLQSDGITPQNLSGWTLTLYVKVHAYDKDNFAVITSNGAITNAVQGDCTFTLASADTAELNLASYIITIRAVDPTGQNTTVFSGVLTVSQS